ncbi:MAG: hypothetical protein JWM63_3274 [Gammaproteobacteria bacterium]|jgi:hypothetical protein|nr:hypothetical protein [Gammaproteobacteria bacterium]
MTLEALRNGTGVDGTAEEVFDVNETITSIQTVHPEHLVLARPCGAWTALRW